MEHVTLGRGGPKVSAIGLGMWQAGGIAWGSDVTDDGCMAAMRRAHELGVNLIDTAEVYGQGHSEEVVGRAIKELGRDSLVIATKVAGAHLRPELVSRACEGSLERLGISEIDLYQIHWPDPWDQVPLAGTMKALEKLHKEGKIRHIGVSNFAVRDLEEARSALSRTDIVENQVHWSLLHRTVEDEVLPYCAKEGIAVLPWSPLEKGILAGKYHAGNKPSDEIRKSSRMLRDGNLAEIAKLVEVLRATGARHGKTPVQVALNWLMRQPGTVVPIPGAKFPAQAEENAGAAGWKLTSPEIRAISDASSALNLDLF
jgi:aryl-alcohol dehydrogenase-like predicted oxidoreductase